MKKLFIYIFSIFYFIFSFNCNAEINLEHDNRFLSKEICDAIYKDINFGNNQINEKINVIADLEINRIDTSHKKGTFVAMMYERYSYEEPLFKKLLRDKYMHVDIVKQRVDLEKRGVPPYALCEYNLVSSIREGKFRKLQIYHPFILQSQVGLTITGLPKNKIQVFSGGMISYVYDDFYVEFQKDDYDFRAFPFDTQQFDVMTATRLTKDFVNLELTLEGEKYFEEMQEKKKYDTIIPGFEITDMGYIESGTDDEIQWANIYIYIDAKRNYFEYVIKFILPIVFIVLISWAVFWIDPKDLKTRVELSIVCLLSLIAFNFVLSDKLPDLNYMTVLDGFVLSSYLFAGFSTIMSIISNKKNINKRNSEKNAFDKKARYLFPASFIIINIIFAFIVLNHPI